MSLRRKALAFLLALGAGAAACFPRPIDEADRSDPGIRTRLEQRLTADPGLDLRTVSIDVQDGVVTLSGIVPSWKQRRAIERTTRSLGGVREVRCDLVVSQ
ncbi:MAG: BON domain-containing protein [Elusimicrobia bacterium]|nr:BON domain-containing protein [Elusimicrobiota bacterium]MDE2424717.1 BON domain-containing protein [Elusimicrobiota bacterium]